MRNEQNHLEYRTVRLCDAVVAEVLHDSVLFLIAMRCESAEQMLPIKTSCTLCQFSHFNTQACASFIFNRMVTNHLQQTVQMFATPRAPFEY